MRLMRAGAAALLAAGLLATAGSADGTWKATPGGWVSGNVKYVTTVPTEAGSAVSATLHGHHLYVTAFRSFSIYDVSKPEEPALRSTRALGAQLFNEQPDTDGRILLLASDARGIDVSPATPRPRSFGALEVWDVVDKANPQPLATLLLSKREHIWTCVLSCTFAYGAGGAIVDLRNPRAPVMVGDWTQQTGAALPAGTYHTIQEVAPGLVLTGGARSYYLDGHADPARPKVLARLDPALTTPGAPSNPTSLPAHVAWPEAGAGRHLLMSMETPFGGQCDASSGGFRTYDTRGWEQSGTFAFADEYVFRDNPGTYTNGRAPHHVWGCSAYAFDVPADFLTTGRVAVAWFEDGVRSLRVDGEGGITEVGGFVPLGGVSSTPIWLDSSVVYVVDLHRGIDILRIADAT